jgi:DNA-binding Xre family transcriptional regulator
MAVFVTQLDRLCQWAYLNDNGLANYARRLNMTTMPNNLDAMIARSSMSKREVASLKGITPETLSRQLHGKIQMTLQDAERYAKILDCTPQDVLFPTPPVPIIGYCHILACNPDDPQCPPSGFDIERKISVGDTMGKVYLPSYLEQTTGAIVWSADKDYSGPLQRWKNAIELVERDPVENQYVSECAIQNSCYVLLKIPYQERGKTRQLLCGTLYPEPNNLFTIHNPDTGATIKGQELVWATATLSAAFRPAMRGVEVILDK